jgi:hypothetical protein
MFSSAALLSLPRQQPELSNTDSVSVPCAHRSLPINYQCTEVGFICYATVLLVENGDRIMLIPSSGSQNLTLAGVR